LKATTDGGVPLVSEVVAVEAAMRAASIAPFTA
jgi:hypothetical protein